MYHKENRLPFLPWSQIDTVLLDMDGTLLDLHFDSFFWKEHLVEKVALANNQTVAQSKARMHQYYQQVSGQLQWYCLDYWAAKLDIDIMAAKHEIAHLISMRDDTIPFLNALRQSGREVVLLTNAHPDNLAMKIERTQLDTHLDTLISTHEFGVSKESQQLWQKVQQRLQFDPARTLFVDDSLPILEAARQFGIAHLLAVANPDSKVPARTITEFPATSDYRELLADIVPASAQPKV